MTNEDVKLLAGGLHAIAGAIERLATATNHLAENARSDHPLMGETLDGVEVALAAIATAIEGRNG